MTIKLIPQGDSCALLLDRATLIELGIPVESTEFDLSSDGRSLILTPQVSPEVRERFRIATEFLHANYAHTLRRLAE